MLMYFPISEELEDFCKTQFSSQHRYYKARKWYLLCLQKHQGSKIVLLSTCLWDITWDNMSFFYAFVLLYEHQLSCLDFINHQLTASFHFDPELAKVCLSVFQDKAIF